MLITIFICDIVFAVLIIALLIIIISLIIFNTIIIIISSIREFFRKIIEHLKSKGGKENENN